MVFRSKVIKFSHSCLRRIRVNRIYYLYWEENSNNGGKRLETN